MIKTIVAFLKGRLYPANQSNLKSIVKLDGWKDWMEKSRTSKKATIVLVM